MEKDVIKEINCNAKNCIHNENGCKCTAGHIDVGTASAVTAEETRCATFQKTCEDCKI